MSVELNPPTNVTVPERLYTDRDLSDRAVRLYCLLHAYSANAGDRVVLDDDYVREYAALDLDCARGDVDRALEQLRRAGWVK